MPAQRKEVVVDAHAFDAQQFGYWFQIGAAGSRGDALISDAGRRFNKSWDGIWYGMSRVTPTGWEAEVRLPFKTLAFREGADTWGFNIRRQRRRQGADLRWAFPLQAYRFFDVTVGGALTGLTGMRQGVGLDAQGRAWRLEDRPGVVDQHVEPAALAPDPADGRLDLRRVGHVEPQHPAVRRGGCGRPGMEYSGAHRPNHGAS